MFRCVPVSASWLILSRSGDSSFIIWIQLVVHSKFIYLITGNKSCPCCLQRTSSEEGDKIQILPVTMSGLWGGRGLDQLCLGERNVRWQAVRQRPVTNTTWWEVLWTQEKALCASSWGFPHFCPHNGHTMGSASGLRAPISRTGEALPLIITLGSECNSWQEGPGTSLSEKPLCWPQETK